MLQFRQTPDSNDPNNRIHSQTIDTKHRESYVDSDWQMYNLGKKFDWIGDETPSDLTTTQFNNTFKSNGLLDSNVTVTKLLKYIAGKIS